MKSLLKIVLFKQMYMQVVIIVLMAVDLQV